MTRDDVPRTWAWPDLAPVPTVATVVILLLAVVGGACGRDADQRSNPTPASEPPVATVGELEIYRAVCFLFPGTGAVYLTIVDTGSQGDRLVSVAADVAAATETHETVDDAGVVRMIAHPRGFAIPAGGVLELAPGGKHIMLIAPRVAKDASGIALDLVFERSGHLALTVPISAPAGVDEARDSGRGAGTTSSERFEEAET